MTDAGPNGHTLSDDAIKAHEAAVEAWLLKAEAKDKARVERVNKCHAVLTPSQIRYRQSRESWLSPLMEQSSELACDAQGNRLYPPSDF